MRAANDTSSSGGRCDHGSSWKRGKSVGANRDVMATRAPGERVAPADQSVRQSQADETQHAAATSNANIPSYNCQPFQVHTCDRH